MPTYRNQLAEVLARMARGPTDSKIGCTIKRVRSMLRRTRVEVEGNWRGGR